MERWRRGEKAMIPRSGAEMGEVSDCLIYTIREGDTRSGDTRSRGTRISKVSQSI